MKGFNLLNKDWKNKYKASNNTLKKTEPEYYKKFVKTFIRQFS